LRERRTCLVCGDTFKVYKHRQNVCPKKECTNIKAKYFYRCKSAGISKEKWDTLYLADKIKAEREKSMLEFTEKCKKREEKLQGQCRGCYWSNPENNYCAFSSCVRERLGG
jgi:hypothetical protein